MDVFFMQRVRRTRWIAGVFFPDTRNCGGAYRAASLLEPVLGHIVPGTADEQRAAAWAACVRSVTVDISFVHIMQPGFPRNLPCAMQSFRRSLRLVAKLEIGMKDGEVQRHVGSEVRQNPFGKFVRLRGVIIQGWN